METRKNISEELRKISPAVANLGNTNVFTVPEGYFDSLAGNILSEIYVLALPQNLPYTVPEDEYFVGLAAQVLQKIKSAAKASDAENAETAFAGLSNLPADNLSVPPGYFDELPASILQKIKAQQNKTIESVTEELQEIAPFLSTISRENVYTVPPEYFQSFKVTQPEDVVKAPVAKVIPFKRSVLRVAKYAAAAVVAGIMFFSGYYFLNNNKGQTENKFYSESYLESLKNLNIKKEISSLSYDDIANYLDTQNISFIEVNQYPDDINFNIQNFLNNATDEEILLYLKENRQPGEKNIKEI